MASTPLGRNLGPGASYTVNLPKPKKAASHKSYKSVKIPVLHAGTFHNAPKQGAGSSSATSSIFGDSLGIGSATNPFANISFPAPPTESQLAEMKYEQQHKSHSSGGVLGLIKNAGGDVLGHTLDILSRPSHAIAGMAFADSHYKNTHSGHNFLSELTDPSYWGQTLGGAKAGLEGKTHYTFSDVLKEGGDLKGHGTIRALTGFGLDVVSDPLNLVGGAGVYAKAADRGFSVFGGLHQLDKAGQEAFVAQHAPEFGPQMLAHMRSVEAKGLKDIHPRTDTIERELMADNAKTVTLEQLANKEARSKMVKYLGIRFGTTAHNGYTLRTPIKIGKTLAEKEKALADGSLRMKVKAGIAGLIHPAYMDPIGHAASITARHTAERLTSQTWRVAAQKLKGFAKAMSVKEQQAALIAGGLKGVVKDGKIVESVLADSLKARGITGEAAVKATAFLHAWHDVTEHLAAADARHGVEYAKGAITDHIYVPHVFEKGASSEKVLFAKSNVSKAGFETHGQRYTYEQQLAIASKAGAGKHIIKDPMELLAHRIAKGGIAASHGILRETLRRTIAKPVRIRVTDTGSKEFKRLTKARSSLDAAQRKIDRAPGQLTYKKLMEGQKRATFQKSLEHATVENRGKIKTLQNKLRYAKGREKGTLTSQLNAAKRERASLKTIALEKPHHQAYTEAMNAHGIEHAKTLSEAKGNLKKLGQEVQKADAGMWRKNPDILEAGWKKVEALSHKGPDGKAMHYEVPAAIHDSIANIEKAMIDPKEMNALTTGFAKAMSTWKLTVTSVNPGYRIRNTISDLWNMYLKGVPATAIPVYATKAFRLWNLARKGENKIARLAGLGEEEGKLGRSLTLDEYRVRFDPKSPAEEAAMRKEYEAYKTHGLQALTLTQGEKDAMHLMRTAHDEGVLSGLFQGDVGRVINRMRNGPGKNPITRYGRAATKFNTEAENLGRLTHYMYKLEHGYSEHAAALEVKAAHFDYEDLSHFEQRTLKNLMPFYTWTRKNVPFQLQSIATHPGRVASYGKLANTSEEISGGKPNDIIGHALDYHPLAFRAGSGYVDPQIGLNDLYNVEHPSRELGLLNPVAGLGYSVLTGNSLENGRPIGGGSHAAIPGPSWLSNLLAPVGLGERTVRDVNGQPQAGPGVNPWVGEIAGQIPLGSYAMSRDNPLDAARKGEGIGPLDPKTLSYGLGLSYTNVDKQNELTIAAIEDEAARAAYIKHLRDQGLMAPSDWAPGHSWFDKYINGMNKKRVSR